ncbi:pyridoxine 5'-phosphate synthase [Paludibacter sp.]
MTKLSVNINKVATIRNARGGNVPDLCQVAIDCERFGAEGITVHPRPDERHIRYQDVRDLKRIISTEFNIEGYPSTQFLELVKSVKPNQVTLVPDPPGAITSNAGWDTIKNFDFLKNVVVDLKNEGIRVSIFIDTNTKNIETAAKVGTDRVELYTEPYAVQFVTNKELAVKPFIDAAKCARDCGLGLNAGHDLSLDNLKYLIENIPWIDEVSIGHALISDALYLGLQETIKQYKEQLK